MAHQSGPEGSQASEIYLLPQLLAQHARPEEAYSVAVRRLAASLNRPVVLLRRRDERWMIAATASGGQEGALRALLDPIESLLAAADQADFAARVTGTVASPWLLRPLDARFPPRWAVAVGRGPDTTLAEMLLDRIRGELGLALELCEAKVAATRGELLVHQMLEVFQQPPTGSAEMYRRIVGAMAAAARATVAVLARGREQNQPLRIVGTVGYPLALVEDLAISAGTGILGFVFRSGEAVLARNDADFPALPRRRLRYRSQSFIAVPLQADQETLGVAAFADRADLKAFDEADLQSVQAIAGAAARMLRSVTLVEERQHLVEEAALDPLTGLLNRRTFHRRLEEELERARRQQLPLAVLMIDVDYFKSVNDSLGHLKGDQILVKVGEILRSSIRVFDVSARYGGDEFAVVMPAISASAVMQTAERIRRLIANVQLAGADITISVSIGVALLGTERASDELLERADQALYRAKAEGRNRVSVAATPAE